MQTAKVVLVSGAAGVTSAVLGFIAEANRLTFPDEIYVDYGDRKCVYPPNAAHTLGIWAMILLLLAEFIASVAGGCCSCWTPPGGASYSDSTWRRRRVMGVVASVLSWVAAVIAVVFYWIGVKWNAPRTRRFAGPGPVEKCYVLMGGVFVRAAMLSLVATTFGIMSCVLLRLPTATDMAIEGQDAVGLPEWQEQEPNPKLAPPPPTQGQAHAQVQV